MKLTSYMTVPLCCSCLLIAQHDRYDGDLNAKVHYYSTFYNAQEIKSANDKATHLLLTGKALDLATLIQMNETDIMQS